jgi:hypothetical protein
MGAGMIEFSKQRTVDGNDFPPLKLNENDMRQISAEIKKLIAPDQNHQSEEDYSVLNRRYSYFNITIKRAASKEDFRTDNPDFFTSQDMPNAIDSIYIFAKLSEEVHDVFSLTVNFDTSSHHPPKQ